MSTDADLRNISLLTQLRANAELIWGFLEQGTNCSANDPPMYSSLCHVWKPSTPAPGAAINGRQPIFESNISPAFVARTLLNVTMKSSISARLKIDTELGEALVRYSNETRFACLALSCK
jgi:hypothetical protein